MFIKSAEKKFLLELQKDGHLYFNTLKYFETCEEIRRDELETATMLINRSKENPYLLKREINGIDETVARITHGVMKGYKGYAFCMHCINPEIQKDEIEFKMNLKDGYALLINNENKFLKKVQKKLDSEKIKYYKGLITYKDFKDFSGSKNPFEKPIRFFNEYEYRLYIPEKNEQSHFDLYIGNIENISSLVQLNKELVFKLQKRTA